MGTEGMKYSLVSREVIADCVETCVGGQWMDGVMVIGGCDKNMPGGMMGMLRANVPAIYVYGGTILPGTLQGPGPEYRQRVRGGRPVLRRQHERGRLLPDRAPRHSGQRLLWRHVHRQHDEFGLRGAGPEPALCVDDGQRRGRDRRPMRRARREVLVEAVKADIKPRDIVTRKRIENAVAVIMATGGSTNAVLHFLAIAHAADVEWTIDDFERVRQRTPGAVRPETQRPVPGGGPAPRRRHPGGDEGTAEGRPAARRLHHHHRPDGGRRTWPTSRRCRAEQEVIRPIEPPDLRGGPPGHPARQPQSRRLRRQDHRPEEPGHHRPGARVRRRAVGAGGHHGQEDRAPAT